MKLRLDAIAVLISIISVGVSVGVWISDGKQDRIKSTNEFCIRANLGSELEQSWSVAFNRETSPARQVNRAYGNIFNFLSMVAMNQELGNLDDTLLLQCLGETFKVACDPLVLDYLKTASWPPLERLVKKESFWGSKAQSDLCNKAIRDWTEKKADARRQQTQ